MALVVYSRRFFSGSLPPNGTILYTAPGGSTVVVRDVTFYQGAGSQTTASVNLLVSGSFAGVIYSVPNMAPSAYDHWEGRVVLNAGDAISSGAAGEGIVAIVSGYLLGLTA